MPDPIARKRLKKRMLDRWENEGGAVAADTASVDDSAMTKNDQAQGKKQSSRRDNSKGATPATPASATKKRKRD